MILQQAVTLLCLCAIGLASPSWAAFPGQKLRVSIDASVIPNDVSEETLHLLEQVLAEVQIEARTEENSADLKKAFEMREIDLLLTSAALYPKSRSKPSRYSSENDVLIEKSVKYTDFFLLSIVYV